MLGASTQERTSGTLQASQHERKMSFIRPAILSPSRGLRVKASGWCTMKSISSLGSPALRSWGMERGAGAEDGRVGTGARGWRVGTTQDAPPQQYHRRCAALAQGPPSAGRFIIGKKKQECPVVSQICTLWPLRFHRDLFICSRMQMSRHPQFCSF